ncbi:hypothetical protein GCM10010156_32150 [Planobispora rosea]|uniref:HTH cro/C1-type domain-containing protein n=1 Tax=Planobispora rosea TaxID=35762 RepID=A0A8J3WDQ5_PLARO|nr:helix-turn-helix transcriptional regulator [Planobispora rosea]GGS70888.1 hypothetical protein GCM10010156_32150 [Planobispora rosea]GIH85398.1 hypothetical protein Pro02_38060 [Planobispora rosea]
MESYPGIGTRIRQARHYRGISQEILGHPELGTGYIARIEAGQEQPTSLVLQLLAERLGVSVAYLRTGEEPLRGGHPLDDEWP